MKLKYKLREVRKSKNLTLKNLASQTGLSVSYLSDIERGRATPSLKTVETLANALTISVQELLTGVEFTEEVSLGDLPEGLQELFNNDEFNQGLDADWLNLLSRIEIRGKRPRSKRDWLELYLYLRRLLDE